MQTLFPSDSSSKSPSKPGGTDPWLEIKAEMKLLLDAAEYKEWIAPLTGSLEDSEIVISLPNMTTYQTIIGQYMDQLNRCRDDLGYKLLYRFEIGQKDSVADQLFSEEKPENQLQPQEEQNATEPNSSNTVSRALTHHSQLNTNYAFENFVNGPSNQFAHASCLAVADAPGQHYNPLFLYGSSGLGKTHLLHAVGNAVIKNKHEAVITYITSERFTNEMIYCLRFNKMWDFRRKYRNCDVLLVDDIQFISGKDRTQEEFFHTFNALYEAKKQIVVTSDIFPQDIPDIEDRLRNRFQWGLIADIQPPDVEHRVAILMTKAEKQGIKLENQVAEYIAQHAKGNVRILEGALHRVIAFATLQGRNIDIQLASEILQDFLGDTPTKSLSIEGIQKIVAEHFKIRVSDLKSKKRQRAFSVPRQIAMYLSRNKTESSFPEIGLSFGGKDHTTVMHAVKRIEKARLSDVELRTQIETVERKLEQL